jgi:hypothetical protein
LFGYPNYLCVELCSDENDDDRHPYPGHEADDRAEGAIGLIVAAEIGDVPRKEAEAMSHAIAAKALPQVIQRHRGALRLGPNL